MQACRWLPQLTGLSGLGLGSLVTCTANGVASGFLHFCVWWIWDCLSAFSGRELAPETLTSKTLSPQTRKTPGPRGRWEEALSVLGAMRLEGRGADRLGSGWEVFGGFKGFGGLGFQGLGS